MRRRTLLGLLGAIACPKPILAQGVDQKRRVGILVGTAVTAERQAWVAAVEESLRQAGWTLDRNLELDVRWGGADPIIIKEAIQGVLESRPEVIVARSSRLLHPLLQITRKIPIVFISAVDPIAHGLADSLAKPGGNLTGFLIYEPSVAGKLVEILKEAAPNVSRVGLLFDRRNVSAAGYWTAINAVAASLRVKPEQLPVHDPEAIESACAAFASESGGGLILPTDATTTAHRELIIELAARHRLPAAYTYRDDVRIGGLISYGPDPVDLFRKAGAYVGRILNGESPGDLPIQAASQFELAVNLRTAAALGLTLPTLLLARADEVIE